MSIQENSNRPVPPQEHPSEISHGPSHQASHLLAKIGIELSEPLTKLDATADTGSATQLTVARGLLPWHSNRPNRLTRETALS